VGRGQHWRLATFSARPAGHSSYRNSSQRPTEENLSEFMSRDRAMALVRAYNGPLDAHLRETLLVISEHYPNPYPSHKCLAGILGVSQSAVKQRIARLTRLGLLETQRTGARAASRAHRRILLPGFPPPTVLRGYAEPRSCERCHTGIDHLRIDARWCSKACREAGRRTRLSARL
jgi:hypothetical protein